MEMSEGNKQEEKRENELTVRITSRMPRWFKVYADSDFNNKSLKTKNNYLRWAKTFLIYLHTDFKINYRNLEQLKNIKPYHCKSYLKTIDDKSESYVAANTYALKYMFKFLYENEAIEKDPMEFVKAKKDSEIHEITVLTEDEIAKIEWRIVHGWRKGKSKDYFEDKMRDKILIMRDRTLFHMALKTGLRVSEIVNMDASEICSKKRNITIIEKGGTPREVFFPESLHSELLEWKNYRDQYVEKLNSEGKKCSKALFINRNGKRFLPNDVYVLVKNWSVDLDRKISPHKFRSTFASKFYEATGDIYLTASMLNHKNIENTKRYAKVSTERKLAAADIVDRMYKEDNSDVVVHNIAN